jgi:4-amino-4-deoxy-L-arabinose transferase-like glycosyltransferase
MVTIDKINSAQSPPQKQESQAGDKEPAGDGKAGLWCWIALVVIIICSAVIRGRLAAMPLERDEGEYAYIAQQMLKGVPPYVSAYSMKLPGIYVVYALILTVFGQTHIAVHLGLIIFNAATILVIFLLTRRMFGGLAGVAAGCAYAIMSWGRPVLGLTANAEHFVLLPALIGITLIARPIERCRLVVVFIAALLFGLAFVIKQHGIFFAVFGGAYLFYSDLCHRPIQWKRPIITQLVFMIGVVVPFAIVCLVFQRIGVFDKFWFWTFIYAREYATTVSLSAAAKLFTVNFNSIVTETVLIWFLALLGLLRVLFRSRVRGRVPFIIGFLIFSFLAVCPGLYFRNHYFILFFPAVAVAAGAGFDDLVVGRGPGFRQGLFTAVVGLAVVGFCLFQQRLYLFQLTSTDVSRFWYATDPFPESLEIAKYLKQNSFPNDTVAVIGSEPQIYFYSNRRSATGYIYVYPLMDTHEYVPTMQAQMIQEIESAKPEWIVFVSMQGSWIIKPESVMTIFDWFNGYAENFYNTVGIVDMPPYEETIYRWDEQATGYKPESVYWIEVLRRKH